MRGKKGSIQMSVGTIVTIVLSMTMLILGIVLVKNILGGAGDITDITNKQALKQVTDLYGDDKKVAILPASDVYEMSTGETSSIRLVIQNLVEDDKNAASTPFSYEMIVSDVDDCSFDAEDVYFWMIGEREEDIMIPVSGNYQSIIAFNIPDGTSFCTFRIKVNTYYGGKAYEPTMMIVETTK